VAIQPQVGCGLADDYKPQSTWVSDDFFIESVHIPTLRNKCIVDQVPSSPLENKVFKTFLLAGIWCLPCIVLLQSGSEPRFEPELLQTGPRSGSKFRVGAEPNPKSGSGFRGGPKMVNLVWTRTGPELGAVESEQHLPLQVAL